MEEILVFLSEIGPVNWFAWLIGLFIYGIMEIRDVQSKLNNDPNKANFQWKIYFEDNWTKYILAFLCSFIIMLGSKNLMEYFEWDLNPLHSGAIGNMGTWLWMKMTKIRQNVISSKLPNDTDDGQLGQ